MVHQGLSNDTIHKLEKYINQVSRQQKTTLVKENEAKSHSLLNSNFSSHMTRQFTNIYPKDPMRIFRIELDGLMKLKVPRQSVKVVSKQNRRLARIESMRKLYQSGANSQDMRESRRNVIGVKHKEVISDDVSIMRWLEELKS